MHLAKLSILLMSCFLVSCNLKPDTPIAKPQKFDKKSYADSLEIERAKIKEDSRETKGDKNPTDSIAVQNPKKQVISYPETTDTIPVKIVYGKAKIDTVKAPRQRLVFVVNSDTANQLNLRLSTQDSLANVRISQIVDSKGNSDGPFGRELNYKIVEKGIQHIIVSESQMQGEPWGGEIQLEIKLGW